jgi:membrane protein implicated in regulation of membrane protease activity
MCHLILLLPLLALPSFWVVPLSLAVPAYAAVVALSVWMYVLIMRSMHRPLESGVEKLEHDEGEVIEASGKRAMVRVESEIWQARCDEELRRGDRVKVLAVEGLTLRVARLAPPDRPRDDGRGRDELPAT